VIADVIAALEAFSDAAIVGSEGSRILVASVPVAAMAARTAILTRDDEACGVAAATVV
jgi:hypothetical protein